jgi:hypothetical protein
MTSPRTPQPDVTGTATGSINGRDVYLTWIRDNSANTVTFKGVVNPDGYASGTTTGTDGAPSQAWGSANALFCDAPAPGRATAAAATTAAATAAAGGSPAAAGVYERHHAVFRRAAANCTASQ